MKSGQIKRAIIRGCLAGVGALITSLITSTVGSDLQLNEVFVAIGAGYVVGQGLFAAEYFSETVNPTLGPNK